MTLIVGCAVFSQTVMTYYGLLAGHTEIGLCIFPEIPT